MSADTTGADPPRRFERYVAIGDSSTEGIDDPDGAGGYRGWANRLAERIALAQGSLMYANLAVRGKLTRQIRDEQLSPALAMRPDLATLFTGSNDILSGRFDAEALENDVAHMQGALVRGGATVLTFTLPDLTPVMSVAYLIEHRVRAMNRALRSASARSGAFLVDFAAHEVGSDPRLWSEDRFHANAAGHARIAAALAHALRLPGADASWAEPLSAATRPSRVSRVPGDVVWACRYMFAAIRHAARGRTVRPRGPKKPELEAVRPPAAGAG